jgi:peroxiredoxin
LLTEHIEDFTKEALDLIAIAGDSQNKLKEFSDSNQFKVRIVADPPRKIVKEYNVFRLVKPADIPYGKFKVAVPSTYLINKDGIIVWRYIGTREDRPAISLMLEAAKEFL